MIENPADPADPAQTQPRAGGLLERLGNGLKGYWNSGTPVSPTDSDAQGVLAPALRAHADKVTTAHEAVRQIKSGNHVFVGTACATPRSLVAALEALKPRPTDVELVHFLTDHAVAHDAAGQALTHYRHRTFFVGNDIRAAVKQGMAEYVPLSISLLPRSTPPCRARWGTRPCTSARFIIWCRSTRR